MSRSLSATFKAALMAQETSEIYHTLLTISGTGISTHRYTDNYEDVQSGGNTYTASAFYATLPDDIEDRIPDVMISVQNVDRAIITDARSATSPPDASISIVLQSDPNVVEVGPFKFKIRNINYDALTLSGVLKYEDILNEQFPTCSYTPQTFPGIFP